MFVGIDESFIVNLLLAKKDLRGPELLLYPAMKAVFADWEPVGVSQKLAASLWVI